MSLEKLSTKFDIDKLLLIQDEIGRIKCNIINFNRAKNFPEIDNFSIDLGELWLYIDKYVIYQFNTFPVVTDVTVVPSPVV